MYGYPYPPAGSGPIRLVADGTNAGTQFYIENPAPVGNPPYNPPLGTRLPAGITIIRVSQNEARLEATSVTEPATTVPGTPSFNANGITFAIGVTGANNQPEGTGPVAARGYRIRVDSAPLTISAVNQSRRYGAANPTLTFSVNGLRNGDTAAQVFAGALSTTATSASLVGTYQILQGNLNLSEYGRARYRITGFEPGTLTVTRAPLTVTANNATRRVGAPDPTFSARYDGFVNGDSPADLGGELRFSTNATGASPAGAYRIIPSGLTSNNYAISYVDGTLTVVDRDLPRIIWPDPAEITYGTPLAATHLNATASFNGQTVAGTFTYNPPLGSVLPAGTQNLQVVFTPNDSINFAPATLNQTIRVNRAPLTIRANNLSRPVGAPNPQFTVGYSGFVNGEDPSVLNGALSFSTPARIDSPVGTYDIVPGGVTSPNYEITFVNGVLTVTNRNVPQITWPDPTAILYGTPLVATHLNATARFNGELVPGVFTYDPPLGAVLPAGIQNLQAVFTPNDSVTFAPVTLNQTIRVNRALLTIRASDASRPVGAPNPQFTVGYSGLVNGDDATDLVGELSFETEATASSPVGTYSIVASGLSSSNYDITYVAGTLTVTNARVYIPVALR
ncbi:MAG: MBG domain-containing protein [Chloroflexaceae bacterium]